mgnify:CR=1 FL=1
MASKISICNLALSNIGKDNITALTDAGAEAKACNQFYDHARDTLLQAFPWSFAGKTQALAEITNDKPGQWGFAYQRPTDCLKVRWVRQQYSATDNCRLTPQQEISFPHEVEGQAIYCDLPTAFLRYTFKLDDPSRYSPLFVDALSWHLAVRLAMPLTRDPKIRADAYQLALAMTGTAQMSDANEEQHSSDIESEFVEVRD